MNNLLERLNSAANNKRLGIGEAWNLLDEAAQSIEQLLQDKTRLDWLSDKDNPIGNVQLPTACVEQNTHSLREAIDCAMETNNEHN